MVHNHNTRNLYFRADDKLCNICSHRSQPRVPILGRPGRSIRRSWARPATSSPTAAPAPSRHSKRPSQTHPSTQTICPSRSSRSILIRDPWRANNCQLNYRAFEQQSIELTIESVAFAWQATPTSRWTGTASNTTNSTKTSTTSLKPVTPPTRNNNKNRTWTS